MKKLMFAFFLYVATAAHAVIYQQPTPEFRPKIEVAALYIEYEGRILLLHRHEHKSQGNLWGIPGGKIDKGESLLQAVIREAYEETGYEFSEEDIRPVGTVYIEYDEKNHFVYHMFHTTLKGDPGSVKINFDEHKGFTWVTPQDGLKMELIKDEDACFKLVYGL